MSKSRKAGNDHLVFISHASTDAFIARAMADQLERAGVATFLDETRIDIGDDFVSRILQSLRRSKELVVLVTPHSVQRQFVWAEIGAAWGLGLRVVGVLHGMSVAELNAMPGFPAILKTRDVVELNHFEDYVQQVSRRIVSAPGESASRKKHAGGSADG